MSDTNNKLIPSFDEFRSKLKEHNIDVSRFYDIEAAFPSIFNVSYKEFLYQKFIIDNHSFTEMSEHTGIKKGSMPKHLNRYGISKSREDAPKKESKFKTISQIEIEKGKVFYDYYNELTNEGKSQTEIAIMLGLRGSSPIASYLSRYHNKMNRKESEIMNKLKEEGISFRLNNLIKHFPRLFGIGYGDFLKLKYIEEKMSYSELNELLGTNNFTITNHLRHFNLSKTLSEARQDAISKGSIDYDVILSKSRKTMKKSNYNSHTQGYAHSLIQEKLTESLITDNNDHIEIITSLNEWSILKDKEVDIPVIIIDNLNNTYKKYSIEFQGSYHHSTDKIKLSDQEKESRLINKGWKHFLLDYDESYSKINEGIDTIINEIKKDFTYKAI
jgi:predicted transcriptional regulator YheO